MIPLAPVQAEPYAVKLETDLRIHLRYRIGGRTVDDGRCGIDNNWVEVRPEEVENADPSRFCLFCFPGQEG